MARTPQLERKRPSRTSSETLEVDGALMRIKVFILILLSMISVSCSVRLKLVIINNAGLPISIYMGKSEVVLIDSQHTEIYYPSVSQERLLKVSLGECLLEYRFPEELRDYFLLNDFSGIVVAQVERDGRIYLVAPRNLNPIDVSEVKNLQESGFPLEPSQRGCL